MASEAKKADTAEVTAKSKIIGKYRVHTKDTGSPEVQIALLTSRLDTLAEHFKSHKMDLHSQRGMMKIISKRKGLLQYLKSSSPDRYKKLIGELGLRK